MRNPVIGGSLSDSPFQHIADGAGGAGGDVLISVDLPADVDSTYSSTTELLAPGSNTDGVLVNWAHLTSTAGSTQFSSILAATSSPSSFTDGRAIMIGRGADIPTASNWNAVVIPAGYGIYVVPNGITVGVNMGWSALPSGGVIFPEVGESIIYGSGYAYTDAFTSASNTNGAIITGFTMASVNSGSANVYIGSDRIAWRPTAVGSFAGGPMLVEAGKQFRLYHWGANAWAAASYTLL